MAQKVMDALKWGVKKLKDKGIEEPRLDAEVLLAHSLGRGRTQLYVNMGAEISDSEMEVFRLLIERRGLREPVSYITGVREFMSLEFEVNPDVLIPRPETELLVEKVIAVKPRLVVDVGTGSGAVAISIARYLPDTRVIAVDISQKALDTARRNAARLGVESRVEFLRGSLLEPLIEKDIAGADVIAANLPYIPAEVMGELPPDVRLYEPSLALDGGEEGLDLYKNLINQVTGVLRPGGLLLMEIGYNQGALLEDYLKTKACFENFGVLRDLAGMERVVSVSLTG